MAKKKGEETKIQPLDDQITSEFGDNILVSGNHITSTVKSVIPVSPALDVVLGGGIPVGSFVLLTGKHKIGKTVTSLTIAKNAQNPKYNDELTPNGRMVYYINVEYRIKSRDLLGIHGLDLSEDKFKIIQSAPGKILTAEEIMAISEKILNQCPGCVLIIDSFSALCTADSYSADIKVQTRDSATNLLGKFCRRNANVIGVNQNLVIGITHIMANTGGSGMSLWSEASGTKIQYQCDVKLKGDYTQKWMSGETQIGQDIFWSCPWSAIGPPGSKCASKLRYGYGLDKEMELVQLCVDLGLIKRGGSWYTIGEEKFQGIDGVRELLMSKPELYNDLNTQVRSMLGLCAI